MFFRFLVFDFCCDFLVGYSSCISSQKLVASDGDIYFGGSWAASSGTIVQGVNSVTNVYCSGFSSCEYMEFTNGNNICCLSIGVCENSGIFNFENVYAYATSALWYGEIFSSKNVYCNGYQSCYVSTIIDVTNNVIGKGYQSLYFSDIENVNGSVIGIGYASLQGAFIDNATNVCLFVVFFSLFFCVFFRFRLSEFCEKRKFVCGILFVMFCTQFAVFFGICRFIATIHIVYMIPKYLVYHLFMRKENFTHWKIV